MDEDLDRLHFYKAKIYDYCGPYDDRLQVRILPQMVNLADSECGNLPCFPPFFKGQVIMGKTEKDDGYDNADYVYCVAVPDFTYGYVLGKSNFFESSSVSVKMGDSYNYKAVENFLDKMQVSFSELEYQNICVQSYTTGDSGMMIDFFNYKTGEKVIMLTSGTIVTIQHSKVFIRVGTPAKPTGSSTKPYSIVDITPTAINIKTPNLIIDAKHISLGKHGQKLTGVLGLVPTAVDGQAYSNVSNISV